MRLLALSLLLLSSACASAINIPDLEGGGSDITEKLTKAIERGQISYLPDSIPQVSSHNLMGTGFIVSKWTDGEVSYIDILTAGHVVQCREDCLSCEKGLTEDRIGVVFHSGNKARVFSANVVAISDEHDIALIRIIGEHDPAFEVVFSTSVPRFYLRKVRTAGYVRGYYFVMASGELIGIDYSNNLLAHLPVVSGMSGSPIFDSADGTLIGMIVTKIRGNGEDPSIASAVDSENILKFLNSTEVSLPYIIQTR